MNISTRALNIPVIRGANATASPATASASPSRARRIATAVWRHLEAMGRSRARREMLILADRWALTRPELAAQLRESVDLPDRT